MNSPLFETIRLRNLELQNRIIIAPMCQYSAQNGNATDWHLIHLGHLALSGAGLLILEATAVEPEGRISPQDLGLWSDKNEQALGRVIDAVRQYSPIRLGIQLAHAGRKASTHVPWEGGKQIASSHPDGWRTCAPSALSYAENEELPEALTITSLARIKEAFAAAARRAENVGMDTIELHAAHGYLLHQFLSPLSNKREDEYGGSLENRMRFPLEIFETIRLAFPVTKPVGVRISATDWVENGWDLEQTLTFVDELKKRGCDFIHVSTGGLSPAQSIPVSTGYQVPFAETIKRETELPTIAVGLITEPGQADMIIESGQADMVSLARGMLYDPRWPWHAAAKLGAKVHAPNQYLRCQPHGLRDLFY